MTQQLLSEMLLQNKLTCSFAFNQLNAQNGHLRLTAEAASVGFIYRHIGETMNLFGYFFGEPSEVQNTTMGQADTGQGSDIAESTQLIEKGFALLEKLIANHTDEWWLESIETPFFGSVSRFRLFSHILFHNAHHAGQISLTLSKAVAIA